MRFWISLHQVLLKKERLESQIIVFSFGAIKPKGINSIAKID
jgi:hypothetical protein